MRPVQIVVVLVLLLLIALFVLALRRRYLLRGGAVDMSIRLTAETGGRGWVLGVGRYAGDDLLWFRAFSYALRATHTLSRGALEVVGRRTPDGSESWSVQPGSVIVECRHGRQPVQLAMTDEALTGFLSWLESRPPGYTVPGWAAGG